jgi:pimeloyl-ACP methyl ester carboxylesterase
MFHRTVVNLLGNDTKFTLVLHDWGCIVGMMYENKYASRVHKMVLMDVGIKKDLAIYDVIVILTYQWWFAISYIWSQIFGLFIGNIVYFSYALLVKVLPFLSVTLPNAKMPRKLKDLSVHMCYLYYQFWKSMILRDPILNAKFPSCPVLYLVLSYFNSVIHL